MRTQYGDQIIINIIGHDPDGAIDATSTQYVRGGVAIREIKGWPKLRSALSETIWQWAREMAKENNRSERVQEMMYSVYICENCGTPLREPINGESDCDLPWTKIKYCQRCRVRRVFLRDACYPIQHVDITHQPFPMSVYLFRAQNGLYKIGISSNPATRLAAMGTGPVAIELARSRRFENAKNLERDLHIRFSDKRVRGEWFALEATDVTYIQALDGSSE